jgi:hypothetical protein
MKAEWFEEVGGERSSFGSLYYDHHGNVGDGIASAFRTLLAEDAAAGEPELTSADIMTQGEVAILRQQLACKTSESDALIAEVERLRGFIESAYLEGWADSQDGKPCWDNSATRARLEGEA